MDAPDLVRLMAELDDEPEEGVEFKAIVVAHCVGDRVMRFGETEADRGYASIKFEVGRVRAIRVDRRGVAYRVRWAGGEREWCGGDELEPVDGAGG